MVKRKKNTPSPNGWRYAHFGRVMAAEFKKLSQLAGRHVVYVGRRGETHIVRFPD